MDNQKNFAEELAKDIKKKKVRKYVLIALAAVVVISAILGLNIEDKDSKIPDGQGNEVTTEQNIDEGKTDEKDDNGINEPEKSTSSADNKSATSTDKKPTSSDNKKPTPEDVKVDNSKDPTASNDGNAALKPDEEEKISVTISIRCDTLSSDMSKLTNQSIASYIPSNGVILGATTYKCTTDNTVFDALNTVCRNNGIQLDFRYESLYDAYYFSGINYLYEYDAGVGSGWMYKVNGWFPNYGCSSYYLSDGDVIEWVYTCDYGEDVGKSIS